MSDEGDSKVLAIVKVMVYVLPLLLKLGIVFLKLKRKQKKKMKIFRKTLKKEGMDKEVIDKLCEDMPELSMRDMIKGFDSPGSGFSDFFDFY